MSKENKLIIIVASILGILIILSSFTPESTTKISSYVEVSSCNIFNDEVYFDVYLKSNEDTTFTNSFEIVDSNNNSMLGFMNKPYNVNVELEANTLTYIGTFKGKGLGSNSCSSDFSLDID